MLCMQSCLGGFVEKDFSEIICHEESFSPLVILNLPHFYALRLCLGSASLRSVKNPRCELNNVHQVGSGIICRSDVHN